jgi:hypothetical protein
MHGKLTLIIDEDDNLVLDDIKRIGGLLFNPSARPGETQCTWTFASKNKMIDTLKRVLAYLQH